MTHDLVGDVVQSEQAMAKQATSISMVKRTLIVEDEITLRETLAYNLASEGYEVAQSGDGAEALSLARAEKFDLIVLDIMLPGLDGLSFCRILRKEQTTPIIMLTARGGEVDRIVGLESGADDYIVKPFSLGEFLARVRAVLRRAPTAAASTDRLESGDLALDLTARRAYVGERELKLGHKEFDLLATLMRNKGAVLSRGLLLEQVWGYDYVGDDRTVDVHMRWLREKIEPDPSEPQRIVTVRGVGYRFEG
jgi:DNA-binding response OmpR family regulator